MFVCVCLKLDTLSTTKKCQLHHLIVVICKSSTHSQQTATDCFDLKMNQCIKEDSLMEQVKVNATSLFTADSNSIQCHLESDSSKINMIESVTSLSYTSTNKSTSSSVKHQPNSVFDSNCHHQHRKCLLHSPPAANILQQNPHSHQSPLSSLVLNADNAKIANSSSNSARSQPKSMICTPAQSIITTFTPTPTPSNSIILSHSLKLHRSVNNDHKHQHFHNYPQIIHHHHYHRHYHHRIIPAMMPCFLLVAALCCSIVTNVNAVSLAANNQRQHHSNYNLEQYINNAYGGEDDDRQLTIQTPNQNQNEEQRWSMEDEEAPYVSNDDKNQTCLTDQCITATGLLSSSMDTRVDPCDNFYKYVCGKWIEDHPIPVYLHSWSHFQRLAFTLQNNLKGLLNNLTLFETKPKVFRNLYDFYHGCLNTTLRDNIGYDQLKNITNDLGGWPMLNDGEWNQNMTESFHWEKAYLTLTQLNLFFLIRIEPMIDFRNTSKTLIKIGPPYQTTENIINLGRAQSGQHHATLAGHRSTNKQHTLVASRPWMNRNTSEPPERLNENNVDENVLNILKKIVIELRGSKSLNDTRLENQINQIFMLQNDMENLASPIPPMEYYQENYEKHLMKAADIKKLVDFDLIYIVEKMFGRKFMDSEMFFVPDLNYLQKLGPLIKATPPRTMANYFAGNMVYSMARFTTTKMIELLVTKLNAPEVLPNVCFEETSLYLPELLGKLYVDVYSNQNTSNNLGLYVKLLHESFYQLLNESQWMDKTTIGEALAKLDAISMNIAYPEWYTNETKFEKYCKIYDEVDLTNYFSSVVDVNKASRMIAKHELYERFNSDTNQSTSASWPKKQIIDVNAFYYFSTNGIYIPAGIVQYPFYQDGLPMALSFGSIGMIIGHEMTHAFDNSGRLYDMNGSLRNWWSNNTLSNFSQKTDCFVKQYDSYEVSSIKINGTQTLAENIADNSGLREAYRAFQISQKQNPDFFGQLLPGQMSKFDSDQLFFISFAYMWCTNMDKSSLQDDNVHSPPPIRVHGSLANFDKFSQAFHCAPGTKMNPSDKCILW